MNYIKKSILPIFFAMILGLSIFCSSMVYLMMPGPLEEESILIINPGTPIKQIAKELHQHNIISHPIYFTIIAKIYNQVKGSLKSGEYDFTKRITPLQVIRILSQGQSIIRKLIVPEGTTVHEVIGMLEGEPRLIGELQENITEGFLMPSTYFYSFRDQRSKILSNMKKLMSDSLDELMPLLAADSPIKTRLDVLALASIVEKEAMFDDEKPHIAGVFINRLKRKMKLQADPTAIYAITEGKSKLGRLPTRNDMKIKSPFNTYYVLGLPPTPIACPGRKSIEAVIKPMITKDLYFVVDGTGRHKFSSDMEAHNQNIVNYRQQRKKLVVITQPNT